MKHRTFNTLTTLAFTLLIPVSLPTWADTEPKETKPAKTVTPAKDAKEVKAPVAKESAKEAVAVVTESGLSYTVLQEGTGPKPTAADTVKVHYKGTLLDGKEFDSSYKRGQPATFPLSRVIKCWTEGVQRMKVGGKAKLVCPPAIAYGANGAGSAVPPNATLNFEVELLEIVKP